MPAISMHVCVTVRRRSVSSIVFVRTHTRTRTKNQLGLARIQFKIAALTFDCVGCTGPVYLKQAIGPVSESSRRSLRSAGRGDLFVLRANTSIGQRSFSIAAPAVWNALPPDLRSTLNSRRQFRSKLKTHLFRQAYNTA